MPDIHTLASFDFDGDELAVVSHGGTILLVIRHVCDGIGIAYSTQLRKMKLDPSICVVMMSTQIPGDDQRREVACIDVRSLPLWLATIHPSKVRPELREKLIRYKLECAEVLATHFLGSRGAAPQRIQQLEDENLVMRAELEMYQQDKSGVIGHHRARNILLPNLREAARLACLIEGDMSSKALQRETVDRDNQVRLHVRFPRSAGQSWENLPIAKFGDALGKVMEIKARESKRARRIMKLAIDSQLKLKFKLN